MSDTNKPAGLPTDLIGLAEAAKLLPGIRPGKRMHTATLWRWATKRKKLPSWTIGRNVFVSRSDVLRMAKANCGPVEPEPVSAAARTEEHRAAVEYLREVHGLTCD